VEIFKYPAEDRLFISSRELGGAAIISKRALIPDEARGEFFARDSHGDLSQGSTWPVRYLGGEASDPLRQDGDALASRWRALTAQMAACHRRRRRSSWPTG